MLDWLYLILVDELAGGDRSKAAARRDLDQELDQIGEQVAGSRSAAHDPARWAAEEAATAAMLAKLQGGAVRS
jgi:hypothetical protein